MTNKSTSLHTVLAVIIYRNKFTDILPNILVKARKMDKK
jgi:hypothetical protein